MLWSTSAGAEGLRRRSLCTVPVVSPASARIPVSGNTLATVARSRMLVEHLRDASSLAWRAERLATQIDRACVDTEEALQASISARDAQQLAWLVLCDRGWCQTYRTAPHDAELVRRWLSLWAEFVMLPVRLRKLQDLVQFLLLRRKLSRIERELREAIPPSVWYIVDPLDGTGRATLACALQALEWWVEMRVCADTIERTKARQLAFLSLLSELALSLRLWVPEAPLDLDGWRAVAVAARDMAAAARQGSAA